MDTKILRIGREQMDQAWEAYKALSDRAQTLDEAIAEPHFTETREAHKRWMAARSIYLRLPWLCPADYRCCSCLRPSLSLGPIPAEIAEAVDAFEGWGNLEEGEAGGYCPHCLEEWQHKYGERETNY